MSTRMTPRLKKLEKKLTYDKDYMVVFDITGFNDPVELEREKNKLVEEYIGAGNPNPNLRVFINEVPI